MTSCARCSAEWTRIRWGHHWHPDREWWQGWGPNYRLRPAAWPAWHARYCSPECHRAGEAARLRAYRASHSRQAASHTRKCACGETFTSRRSDARFCSGRCRVAAHRELADNSTCTGVFEQGRPDVRKRVDELRAQFLALTTYEPGLIEVEREWMDQLGRETQEWVAALRRARTVRSGNFGPMIGPSTVDDDHDSRLLPG